MGTTDPANGTARGTTPPVDVLACVPIALCCGCLRLFPEPPDAGENLQSPCCHCDAMNWGDCIETVAALVVGDWHGAGLVRPQLAVGWHADTGLRLRGKEGKDG